MKKTIVEAVLENAERFPEKLAVCFKNEKITYAMLAEYSKAAASILRDQFKIVPGDIVMVSALSKPEYVVTLLGTQFLGATVVPLDKALTEPSIIRMYNFVKPNLFLTNSSIKSEEISCESLADFYNEVKQHKECDISYVLPDENSIAEIIFTTGTTGDPKGAMLSYKSILTGTIYTRDGVNRNEDCIELISLPLNHSFGLRVLRTLLYVGATAILQNGFMFIKETKQNFDTFKCNGICMVPASMERLQRNLGEEFGEFFKQLSYIEISAGSLSIPAKQRTLEMLPDTILYNVWGSSETGGVIFLNVSKYPEHIASLGCVAKDVEIRFLDPDGNPVKGDTQQTAGRMVLHGNMQMSGYLNMPEITADTIKDGYLQTSDLAYKTADGFVYMLGRADDIINVGGEKVSPVEIENVCGLFHKIKECACIGGIDKTGEFETVPVLYVVPSGEGFDDKELISYLSKRLEQFKLPKEIIHVDSLPRNSMQKIDKRLLKKMWETGAVLERNPVISAIHHRRSIRNFTDKRVPKDIIEEIVACGYQAPSGHNMQTWKFTVIRNKEEIKLLKEIIPPVAKRNNVYFYGYNNPDIIILVSNDRRNPYGIQDSSCAIQNIMLAAHSLGIGSVWINALMKICDDPEIREKLNTYNIPENHNVWGMIALGYPSNEPSALAKRTNVVEWIE